MAKLARPSIVCIASYDFSSLFVSDDSLPELIDIDNGVLIVLEIIQAIYSIRILQKPFHSSDKLLVCGPRYELQRLHGFWSDRSRRVGDDVGNKVTCRKIVIWSGGITMGGWHDEWSISLQALLL